MSPFGDAPYDILCEASGKFLRVQVKGTKRQLHRKNGCGYYHFNVENLNAKLRGFDIVALVALDIKAIHYYTCDEVQEFKKSKYIRVSDMQNEYSNGLDHVLDTFGAVLVQS